MPKIRKKLKTTGFTKNIDSPNSIDYLLKSGILSTSESKAFKEDHLSFSYFPDEVIHSDTQSAIEDLFFHDSRTIIFNEKTFAPTIRLESKYVSTNSLLQVNFYNENKLLKTPNIPNYHIASINPAIGNLLGASRLTSQTGINDSKIYNKMLKEKHLKSKDRSFNENVDIENNLEDKKYNKITVDYDLHKSPRPDLYLSFSKGANTRQVTFPGGKSYYTFNGNTAYFYNNDYTDADFGPFDYLGDVSKNYKVNINSFLNNSPICFNSLSVSSPALAFNSTQWGSIPIDTFGFPYRSKFDAFPRHLIPASNYITKPFVIEKVCLEFKMSNWSFVDYDIIGSEIPCVNFVNFFIINQRGKVHNNTLNDSKEVRYYDTSTNSNSTVVLNNILDSGDTKFSTNNKSNNGTYTQQEIINMQQASVSFATSPFIRTDKIVGVDSDNNKNTKNQQRDLITTISIANYSDPLNNANYINKEKIKDIVDEFVDQSNADRLSQNSQSECIYTDRKFKITAPVKHFYKNKNLPKFTSFNIYPEKPDSSRTNLNIKSGRSLTGENLSNIGSSSLVNDQYSNSVSINEFDFKESKYILNPNDSLVLGVSLSNEFKTGESPSGTASLNFGEDLVKISCSENYPLKLHLIGYYLEDEDKKVIVNKSTKQFKNTKRIGYYQNEVVDQIGSNLAYLDQNFYDRTGYAYASTTDLSSKMKVNSSKNKTKLGNFFRLPKWPFNLSISSNVFPFKGIMSNRDKPSTLTEEYYAYKFINENGASDSSVKYIDCFYNKYRFGMFADRLNYNRIHQFIDAKYQNISKKFMKGFYKQKTLGTVSAKLVFDFSKLNEFKGTNYLKEKIMTGSQGSNKSSGIATLSFTIKDNQQNSVNFMFLTNTIIGSTSHLLNADSSSDLYYNLNNEIFVLSEIDSAITDGFVKSTSDLYPVDLEVQKRAFVDTIVSAINEVDNKSQLKYDTSTPPPVVTTESKDFKLKVTAEVVTSTLSSDKVEVKITLNRKGSLGNPKAELLGNDINSGVIIEDFALEEGDLLNSYNTTTNALYDDSSIIFKDR